MGWFLSLQCVVALYALCTTAKELQVESACCSMIAATLDHTHTHTRTRQQLTAHWTSLCTLGVLLLHNNNNNTTNKRTHTTVLHALPPLCSLVINSTASNVKATRGNTH